MNTMISWEVFFSLITLTAAAIERPMIPAHLI